ncbi:MAG: HD domain-containing protein [Candidatus Poseidoniales archaeon]|jgi:putative hydrolase of HD superfamily|tara:strand:+ start:581 stop:1054 length:474 start_codon:yes stop_codon:yes gene_type:complete
MRDQLKEILSLKNVLRAGWVRAGIPSPESVAAHSWGMSMLALKLAPKELDLARVLSLCIVHDIPEVRVGDLTPHDDTSTKAADELKAMTEMAPEWVALFEEYEQGKTPEAKFVKQLDKLDMALQAERYQDEYGLSLGEFIESARLRIDDEDLQNLLI